MAEVLLVGNSEVKERHPFGPLGLTIITFGVYAFVWWYRINREMRDIGEDADPVKSVLAVTIGCLIIGPPFVSIYNTAQRIQRTHEKAHLRIGGPAEGEMIPALALLLSIVPVINLLVQAYLQRGLNLGYRRLTHTTLPAGS